MLVDSRTIASGSVLEGDLCIIGGGAAGISIAATLAKRSHRIIMLESGGLEYDEDTQSLYDGEAKGVDPLYVSSSRQRYFGGTTNHWAGYCSVFDEEELQAVPGIPMSGWPISGNELAVYYEKAAPLFNLDYAKFHPGAVYDKDIIRRFDSDNLRMRLWHIRPLRFGKRYRPLLSGSDKIRVYLYANAVNIQAATDGGSITHIDARTLSGVAFRVACKHYVLACGALENTRLLLLSNTIHTNGLGNQHDLVGRHFMEHMQFTVGQALLGPEVLKYPPFYRDYDQAGDRFRFSFHFPKAVREREGLRNHIFRLERITRKQPDTMIPQQWLAFGQDKTEDTYVMATLTGILEQTPNPQSRVYLNGEKDALGLNRLTLDWRFLPEEKENMRKAVSLFAADWSAKGWARVQLNRHWLKAPWPYKMAWHSRHGAGTTRMSEDPKQGVVDPDGKMHDIHNLFIAGSSIFPNQSWQTPTYTIGALAVRLADKLDRLLG